MSEFEKTSFAIDCPDIQTRKILGNQNIRSIVRQGRGVIKSMLLDHLLYMEQQLPDRDLLLFKSYGREKSEISCLIIKDQNITGGDNTIILSNIHRSAYPHEENFPDGDIIELFDLAIPHPSTGRRKWLNSTYDEMIVYSGEQPDMPSRATFMHIGSSSIKLYGNLSDTSTGNFTPEPARHIYDIEQDGEVLWRTYDALNQCKLSDFNPYITELVI